MMNLATIDWALLRQQKAWLLRHTGVDAAEGLVNLIDRIQDTALADGVASEIEIFGKEFE
jgi:hypothetical protein